MMMMIMNSAFVVSNAVSFNKQRDEIEWIVPTWRFMVWIIIYIYIYIYYI